jgi:hypothetical protein
VPPKKPISTEEFADEKQTPKNAERSSSDPFKTGSYNYQDWLKSNTYDGGMYTKTEPARSDEEILKDMTELAKKHAQQGNYNGFGDEEFQAYLKEYISSVSPDREGILNRAVNEVVERINQGENYSAYAAFQQIDSQRTDKIEDNEKEPIDYFIELQLCLKKPISLNIVYGRKLLKKDISVAYIIMVVFSYKLGK